jgi:hypothetical protein
MFKQGYIYYEEEEQNLLSFLENKRVGSFLYRLSLENAELSCYVKTKQGIETIPILYKKIQDKNGKLQMVYEIKDKFTFLKLNELPSYLKTLWYEFNPYTSDMICKKDNSFELALYDEFKQIGSGTYGTVYSARFTLDGTMVVFKFTDKNPSVEIEYEMLKILQKDGQHPHIIHMQNYIPCVKNPDPVKNNMSFALVLHYAENGDVFGFIEKIRDSKILFMNPKIEQNVIRTLFMQMVNAVEYSHEHHIVHLDIKPANIAYSNFYQKWIFLDFGFSEIIKENLGE